MGQNTTVASGLAAGIYFVSVVDTQGCIATDSATLVDGSLVRWEIKKKNITCYGGIDGNIGIKFWGGIAPYTSAWLFSNNSTAIGTSDTAYFDLLPSGITQVVVHNQNNCLDDTLQIQLSQPDSFQVKHISSPSSCELAMNGSLKITVAGNNQPYTYQWSNTTLNQAYLSQVYAGDYSVLITDSKGCSTTRSFSIASDSLFLVDAKEDFFYDPNIEENIVYASTNKPGNYSYSWSPTEHLFDPLKKESKLKELFFMEKLRVDVMDEWGCTNFDSVTVYVPPSIYIPNVFTPNGDGDNDEFRIAYEEFKLSRFQFSVFDRWGNVLFQTSDPHFTWSGDGIPSGVYNYQMKYIWDESKKSSNSGTITLMR